MNTSRILAEIEAYVFPLFEKDATGHDFYHMKRVARMAALIAEKEDADRFIAEAAGWLHDIGDKKLFKDPEKALDDMDVFLKQTGIEDHNREQIKLAMEDISFRKGAVPETWEGKIVQDADRLDALGAIGIARTFAYGGARNQLMYEQGNDHTSIQHFYDKLFHLKKRMHTRTAIQIAEQRQHFMEQFINHFFEEWEGQ